MQEIIKIWSENGTNVEMTDAETENGWGQNDEPASENWNDIQNKRDTQQVTDAEARAVRLYGINPADLRGNENRERVNGNKIPIPNFRPMPWAGLGALWNPESVINKFVTTDSILDASIGYDPSLKSPVVVLADADSMGLATTDHAHIRFINCWDYSAENAIVSRQINFGFDLISIASIGAFPLLVCDGYLFVLGIRESTRTINVFRYDLVEWTGNPVDVFDLTAIIPAVTNPYVYTFTEMVEMKDGKIGFFAQHSNTNTVYFVHFQKDFSSAALTTTWSGVAVLEHFCRTDGTWAFAAGSDSSGYPQIVYIDPDDTPPAVYSAGASYDNEKIVDFFPLVSGDDHPEGDVAVACLMHKTVAPYGPFIRPIGFGGSFEFNFSLRFGDALFDYSHPGCFCPFGASAFCVINRTLESEASQDFAELVRFNIPNLMTLGFGTGYFREPSTVGTIIGDGLTGEFSAGAIQVRAFHDGRSVWVLDFTAGTIRRVVAPEMRSSI